MIFQSDLTYASPNLKFLSQFKVKKFFYRENVLPLTFWSNLPGATLLLHELCLSLSFSHSLTHTFSQKHTHIHATYFSNLFSRHRQQGLAAPFSIQVYENLFLMNLICNLILDRKQCKLVIPCELNFTWTIC